MPTANETRIVAITGAASGIGAATALLLAERGYRVLAVDRSLPQDEVAVAMTRTGVHTHRCDISSEDEVGALFSVIAHEHGPLHGLVNSAGVESRLLLRDMAAAACGCTAPPSKLLPSASGPAAAAPNELLRLFAPLLPPLLLPPYVALPLPLRVWPGAGIDTVAAPKLLVAEFGPELPPLTLLTDSAAPLLSITV